MFKLCICRTSSKLDIMILLVKNICSSGAQGFWYSNYFGIVCQYSMLTLHRNTILSSQVFKFTKATCNITVHEVFNLLYRKKLS